MTGSPQVGVWRPEIVTAERPFPSKQRPLGASYAIFGIAHGGYLARVPGLRGKRTDVAFVAHRAESVVYRVHRSVLQALLASAS